MEVQLHTFLPHYYSEVSCQPHVPVTLSVVKEAQEFFVCGMAGHVSLSKCLGE